MLLQFLPDGAELLRNFVLRHIPEHFNSTGGLRRFIVPAFVLHHAQGVLQLVHLGLQHLPLVAEHGQSGVNGVVALHGKLKILPDVLDGHTGFFHAADHPQPLDVAFAELADAAG